MKSARDILAELRITERPGNAGRFTTQCPQCSHLRKKKNVRCLSVRIEIDKLLYHCHHCSFEGAQHYDGEKRVRPGRPKAPTKPKRPVESYYR